MRITDGGEVVADYARTYDRDRLVEARGTPTYFATTSGTSNDLRGRDRLAEACPIAHAFLQALLDRDVSIRPQTAQLNRLLERYGADALTAAIDVALERGAIAASSVDQILDQRSRATGSAPPLPPCSRTTIASARFGSGTTTSNPTTHWRARRIPMTLHEQLHAIGLKAVGDELDVTVR